VVAGRWTYEAARHWGHKNPWGLPFFIVTHRHRLPREAVLTPGAQESRSIRTVVSSVPMARTMTAFRRRLRLVRASMR
jgi:hypothetical protein